MRLCVCVCVSILWTLWQIAYFCCFDSICSINSINIVDVHFMCVKCKCKHCTGEIMWIQQPVAHPFSSEWRQQQRASAHISQIWTKKTTKYWKSLNQIVSSHWAYNQYTWCMCCCHARWFSIVICVRLYGNEHWTKHSLKIKRIKFIIIYQPVQSNIFNKFN